jgi:hypothetical protein
MRALTRDEYARLKRIVGGALSQSVERRGSYLDTACGSDAALRGEAEWLLAAALEAAPLYEAPSLSISGLLMFDAFDQPDDGRLPSSLSAGRLASLFDDGFTGTERYQVRRRIGSGGMGIVYEVHDRTRDRVVALKTLRRQDGRDIYQLKREFRSLADVSHPNLASLYELVVDDAQCFFTMELVDGLTFVDYVRQPSDEGPAARVRRLLPQLIAGVEELHRRGMLHRDIKPSNVLVTPSERVVILDFGLTSPHEQADASVVAVAGTPAYLSPEQCAGGSASRAGDWYGVGVTVFQALAGRLPFDGATARDLIARKLTEEAPRLELPSAAPSDLGEICAALLARDPARRMSGREALHRLGAVESTASSPFVETVFVGRAHALTALSGAFEKVRHGGCTTVLVYGPSGIGKSALVQHFIHTQVAQQGVLILRSRCHEYESIPYKALDGVIDGVTQHLAALTPSQLSAVLPEDAAALVTLFPVMRAIGLTPVAERGDPISLRRKAFNAFRQLLNTLAQRQPLILDIDDFHWADADSLAWLTELLRPPSPAALLTVVSFRSNELEAKPFLRALIERVDIGDRVSLALTPMSDDETMAMVSALGHADSHTCAAIAHDSGGNPFLIEAWARHRATDSVSRGGTTVEEMLARRVDALPPGAAAFLNALAVCGRPALPARIWETCGFVGDERPLVARLRGERLIRNSRTGDRVEMYHDRIREVLAARVSPDAARTIHDLLARALVAHGDEDPEGLFDHYRAAGYHDLAAEQAVAAAAKASGVLAFDLAATFYRQALELRPDGPDRAERTADLARALENAGRPVEAAEAFLAAAAAVGSDHIEWTRKAAELLLIGGQIDRGLAVSQDVLNAVGMQLASGPRTAVASLVCRRLQLRWRGLEFTPREESQIPPGDLLRIDAAWSISAGLAMVEPIRAAAFNVRQLLRALDVGEPYRIARAMALEAGFSVVGVGTGLGRSDAFSRRARELAAGAGHPYFAALTSLWEGIAAFLTGQWKKASELCGRAATTFSEECTGVTWELNMAHNFFLGGLAAQGELGEVGRHLPGLISAARDRGNFYLELELNTRMILVWLAADDPDGADRRGNEGIARWSQRGFQRQHYNHLLMRIQSELYRGNARGSWALVEHCRTQLRRSLFLRVQHTRIEAANYHARCALAVAATGHDRDRMRRAALDDVRQLERENRPWASAFAQLLRATVAHLDGEGDAAIAGVTGAMNTFTGADMHLYAAVSRRRLGGLIGGEQGQALKQEADRFMTSREVRNPVAMTRLIAPGLPD